MRHRQLVAHLSILVICSLAAGNHACDCSSCNRDGTGTRRSRASCGSSLGSGFGCSLGTVSTRACGNGILDPDEGEECDEGYANSDSTPDSCRRDCRLPRCGDGVVDSVEACDPEAPSQPSCQDLGFQAGVARCSWGCRLDTTDCRFCGNGLIEPGEECDGSTLGSGSCEAFGYAGGSLACTPACRYGFDQCLGQCGDGTCQPTLGDTAANCPAECGWREVAVGAAFACATRRDASTWCWGQHTYGQLGTGRLTAPAQCAGRACSPLPIPTAAASPLAPLAAGTGHACGIDEAGQVLCWGLNAGGQLGTVDATAQTCGPEGYDCNPTPSPVPGIPAAHALALGDQFSCALTPAGAIWCWGKNDFGQLGDDWQSTQSLPVQVVTVTDASAIAAGHHFACALRADGTVWCWGRNSVGQLGLGMSGGPELCGNTACSRSPVQVLGVWGATAIAAGAHHACAALGDGTVWCWGNNADGQLGDGTYVSTAFPGPALAITDASALAAATTHTCALSRTGQLRCWGLGIEPDPGLVTPWPAAADPPAQHLSAGGTITCAATADRLGWCWGDNTYGALGDDTTTSRPTPARIVDR